MRWIGSFVVAVVAVVAFAPAAASARALQASPVHYVRYSVAEVTAFGILEGETVRELDGDFLAGAAPTGVTHARSDVRLLAPVVPGKVIAVGLNYASHLGGAEPADEPGLFAKYPSSIVGPGEAVVIPEGARVVHYEGELVVVVGRTMKNVAAADALDYVFGVTAGNDVSERAWQASDLQWLRAKAADTFGPIGPAVVTGLNFQDLLLQTRLNGDVVQSERTADLLFGVPAILEYVSRYITLEPGDLIFTGTPGTTRTMRPGDVVEVELEGVGVLTNPIVGAGG